MRIRIMKSKTLPLGRFGNADKDFRPSTDQGLAGASVVVDAATGDRDESCGENHERQ